MTHANKLKDNILRLRDKIVLHFHRNKLPPPTVEETQLAQEFRCRIAALNISTGSDSAAEHTWKSNMLRLQQFAKNSDPRNFLSWDVVGGTMFVKYAKYSRTEYNYLRSLLDWPNWKEAIKEDRTGNPTPCPFDSTTSCNLIHHAYHLAQLEQFSRKPTKDYKNVVEFGGGYGSMCRLFFKRGFEGRYVIIDLPAFSILQEYFLKSVGIKTLSKDEFIEGKTGVLCTSDLDSIKDLIIADNNLFVATWSISESPLSVREKIIGEHTDKFDSFLIAFQPKFEDIDNDIYFSEWLSKHRHHSWSIQKMEHLKNQKYIFGKRTVHTDISVLP